MIVCQYNLSLADAGELCNRGVQFLQDNRAACG